MAGSQILNAWRTGATDRLPSLMSEDAVFSSPYADYAGRGVASHVLRLVGVTLDEVEPTGTWGDGKHSLTTFTAQVSGHPLEGLVHEEGTADVLTHVTLWLRSFDSLKVAMRQMARRLEHDPVRET